jgi:diadenosine tetraphosphatase ApaH/serine/threonine PP2A family protein phosphatase
VLGHTHHPWLYEAGVGTLFPAVVAGPPGSAGVSLTADTRHLVNPGAVGQSRERETRPRARFALIDLARAHVSLFAEPYDAAATRAALRSRQLPRDAVHVRPGRVAAATRRAGRLLSLASASLRP